MHFGFKSFLVLVIITSLIAISIVGIRLVFRTLSVQMASSDYGWCSRLSFFFVFVSLPRKMPDNT